MAKASKAQAKVEEAEVEQTEEGYDALLKGTWGSIGKAKEIPEGTYKLKVRNIYPKKATTTASGKTVSAQLVVFVTPLEPILDTAGGDVDADAFGELGEDYDLSANQATATFWVGEQRDWQRVFEFFEKLGIEFDEVSDLTREEVYKMARGRTCLGYLKNENYPTSGGEAATKLVATAFSKED